jgi:hypothetical protein
MSDQQTMSCAHCGTKFELSRKYVEQYAGQNATCTTCSQGMKVPSSWSEFASNADASGKAEPVLAYEGPEFSNKRGTPQHWVEGDLLVIQRGADVGPWCVYCNADAPHPHVAFVARWSQSARDAPTTSSAAVAGFLESAKMRVKLGLCPKHAARRRLRIRCCMFVAALGIAATGVGLMMPELGNWGSELIPGGIVATLVGLMCTKASKPVLEAVYVDRWKAKFTGANPQFLLRLPAREQRVRPPDASSAAFDQIQ